MLLGGLIFDSAVDRRYLGMFFGGLLGCLIARLLNYELFGESKNKQDSVAIRMLLKEEENVTEK